MIINNINDVISTEREAVALKIFKLLSTTPRLAARAEQDLRETASMMEALRLRGSESVHGIIVSKLSLVSLLLTVYSSPLSLHHYHLSCLILIIINIRLHEHQCSQ
jgi:hypothetical protein